MFSVQALRTSPLDLHVLGTPPAFVLSQDQTLMFNLDSFSSSELIVDFAEVIIVVSLWNYVVIHILI